MTTATTLLAKLIVVKSGKHTHYTADGYFICPTHQNYRQAPVRVEGEATCSKCIKRLAQIKEHAALEAAEAAGTAA